MRSTVKKQVFISVIWLFVMSFGLFTLYELIPPEPIDVSLLVSFSLMALIVTLFPLMITGYPILLIQWIGLAVFLKFGLVVEIIFFQIALLVFFVQFIKSNARFLKWTVHSIKYFIASTVSGLLFIVFGGKFNSIEIYHVILFSIIHQAVFIFVSNLLSISHNSFIGKINFLSKKMIFRDAIVIVLALPFGIALYFLANDIGSIACILLITPFIFMSYILRKYDYTGKVNQSLKAAVNIGHELSETLSLDRVTDLFIQRISDMVPGSKAYLIDEISGRYVYIKGTDDKCGIFGQLKYEQIQESIIGQSFTEKKQFLFDMRQQWAINNPLFLDDDCESLMIIPIQRNNAIKGILVLVSSNKSAFHAYQVRILDLLCSYLAVALENIRYVEETIEKSEQCALTELHNYRYFDKQVAHFEKCMEAGYYSEVSLIMMDIDHFKSINDTYGHESGNIILQKFAAILRENIRGDSVLARYGGEEFVILLPNVNKEDALKIAERLRVQVEKHRFDIIAELSDVRSEISVYITVSIGVSTSPEDDAQVKGLLRNADRALYVGAKQNGRNRVASYEK